MRQYGKDIMHKLTKVSWGIIGCGEVTEVKSGPALQLAKASSLVAVMRRNGTAAADYARRHKVPKWYDQADALIHDPEVNAVYIATPPSSHKDYCLQAAAAGKAVYVEKPMAMNYAECLEMVRACDRAEVPLYVAYYRRALPKYQRVKEIIDSGVLGRILSVDIILHHRPHKLDLDGIHHWRVDPTIAGGGYFYDLASHVFDLLQFILGPIQAASGNSSNIGKLYDVEDQVSCSFKFDTEVTGAGNFLFHAPEHRDRTTISGEKGSISYPHFTEEDVLLKTDQGLSRFSDANPKHIQQALIQSVVNDLISEAGCPSTGASAATANLVLEKILYGAKS